MATSQLTVYGERKTVQQAKRRLSCFRWEKLHGVTDLSLKTEVDDKNVYSFTVTIEASEENCKAIEREVKWCRAQVR